MKDNKILNREQIKDKIKRISYQIYEKNFDNECLIICGVEKNGSVIAKKVIQSCKATF